MLAYKWWNYFYLHSRFPPEEGLLRSFIDGSWMSEQTNAKLKGACIFYLDSHLNCNSDQWLSEYQQMNIWFFWIRYLVSGILMVLDNNGNYATEEWLSHNLAIWIPRLFQFSHGYCSDLNRPFDDVNSRQVCILDPFYCFKLGDLNQVFFCFGEI